MQKILSKKVVLLLLFFICPILAVFSQTYVNKEWSVQAGNPLMLQWSNSLRLSTGDLLVVGNTQVAGQGANVLLTKYKRDGSIAWTTNYNTSGTKNDYGINLVSDASGNIYVCGTSDNNGIVNYDIIVLKYNSSGSLLWDTTYNSPYSKNDIASSIVLDNSNNIYVGASSEGDTTQFDYLAISYTNAGQLQWASRYNYASLHDYAIGLSIENNNTLYLTGTSANAGTDWDFTTVKYNLSGNQLGVLRNAVAGSGYDQPFAYVKDNAGNIYVTGKGSINGTDYDMKTIKIKSNFTLDWNVTYNGANADDQGNAIAIDQNNEILVGGYYTNTGNRQVARIIKYDNAGNELWNYERYSDYSTGNAQVKALDVDADNNTIVLIEQSGVNNFKDLALVKMNVDGGVEWERIVHSSNDKLATGVKVNTDGSVYITYIRDIAGATSYTVESYTDYTPSDNFDADSNGKPVQMKNELVIRFKESALNYYAIDNAIGSAIIEYNDLSYYLKQNESNLFYTKLQNLCSENPEIPCKIIATKIFHDLKTGSNKTISRLGDTIAIPSFWACLRVIFPDGINKQNVIDSLKKLPNVVIYSEPDFIIEPYSSFNDNKYLYQYGLHQNNIYPYGHINIEEAWDYTTGDIHTKVGIIDDGVNWNHEDFKTYGGYGVSSKIFGRWDCLTNSVMAAQNIGNHATKVAGIIGAQTGNGVGISGIAGGKYSTVYDCGAALYSMRILNFPLTITPIVYAYNGIVSATIDSLGSQSKWGVQIMNNSYGLEDGAGILPHIDTNFQLLKEAAHFVSRANVTFVAARGNSGFATKNYPAISDDDWVLNVGGSGLDSNYCWGFQFTDPITNITNNYPAASYGYDIDVIAPYRPELTLTTLNYSEYNFFLATSASAAYVTGVASLLMSYLNDTLPNYNNMAPEDIENILQYSAKDANQIGVDDYTGYGLLDAGAAFRLVSKPTHQVLHFGTNGNSSFTKVVALYRANDTLTNLEWYSKDGMSPWYKPGKYIMNTYRIDAQIFHNINSVDTIQYYWPRTSSSNVLQLLDTNNKKLLPRERIVIDSLNANYAKVHGFIYKVSDSIGNFITWWPFDTSSLYKANFEYTVLTHNGSSTGIFDKEINNNIRIYPNPAISKQTIAIQCNENLPLSIYLYDINGKIIDKIYEGKSIIGMNRILSNLTDIPNGVYYYKIDIGSKLYYEKITKNN